VAFVTRVHGLKIDGPVLVSSLFLNVLGLLMPLATLLIFDRVIPFQSTETLTLITLILVGSALCEFALRWSRSAILGWASQKGAIHNHAHFLERLLTANTEKFKGENKSYLLETYASVGRLRDFFSGQNQALVIDVPFAGLFIVMIALIGGWLVVVPLGVLVCVLVFSAALKYAQASTFEPRKQLDKRRYAFMSEVLEGIISIKANTMERQMTRRFELLQKQSVASSQRLILFSGFAQNLSAVLAQTSVAALGLMGAFLVIEGHIGIAELASCMMLNGRVTQPLTKLISLWVQAESISQQRKKLAAVDALAQTSVGAPALSKLSGRMELAEIELPIPSGASQSHVPVSALIHPGEIGLIAFDDGFEGAPANLFSMLTGQSAPQSGKALIDGYLAQDVTRFRGKGGLVLLEDKPAIFHGTLMENLTGFGGTHRIDLVLDYSRQIGLESRVNRLPMGYNTVLKSGGNFETDPVNKQLIALTRAFAQAPSILLMNEPSAVLENRERDQFKSFIEDLPNRPTILLASPDPRLKALATQTLTFTSKKSADLDAWYEDACLEEMEANQKGAA